MDKKEQVKTLYLETQMYKNIPLQLINRNYRNYHAMRFTLNGTNQNVWIPKKHLYEDGQIKENEDIDYVFKRSVRQMILSGLRTIGDFVEGDFRVIVAGGRDFNDFGLLERKLNHILHRINKPITIISGGAKGADFIGEWYAKKKGYNLVIFPPDWNGPLKKRAGLERNIEMAKFANACVCFWDGKSTGTAHMIRQAENHNLQLRVIHYNK